ncbi:MAG TPA: hypothetical protein VGO07_03665, partial [Candidatus Saccharimonadales bacterium]|nr:hypothetical protein [Candidatus Saccharimonadales bacterium]
MSHSPALDPNINGSDPSPWGEVVDDDAWLKLLEARGLNQGVDDEPAALPVGIVTPTSNSPATTLPIHLDPTPRLVSDYLSGKIEAETVSEVKAVPHLEYAGDWWQGENL